MKISVTQQDIDDALDQRLHGAQYRAGRHCPINRAAERATGKRCATGRSELDIIGEEFLVLPPEAQHFIKMFDGNEPVSPIEFEVP